jgi:PAS domain-containing protein
VGLQAAVHQLDQVVDSLADPLLVTDLEHNMILCNAVFRRVFGLDEDAEPDCARLLQGMSGGRWSESFARFARRPGIYRIPAGPGNGGRAASSHLLTLSPYVSPEGELVGVIYTFTPLARTGGA